MKRAPLWPILAAAALLTVACSGGPITVGPGATAPGSDGLTGTLSWTEHQVTNHPVDGLIEFDDEIVLNLRVSEPTEGQWVDAGSTYTRNGTARDACSNKNWSSSGTVNVNDDASLVIDGVDRAAGKVYYTAFIGAELHGTNCQSGAINQTAMEWTNIPTCEEPGPDTVLTGEMWGSSTDGGSTIVFNCTSVADESTESGVTIHTEKSVTGQLIVAPPK